MKQNLPVIIVTGASGFIGRHFLEQAQEEYIIYAFARRTMQEVGVSPHKNIKWILVDIGEKDLLSEVIWKIQEEYSVDFILHLAAYYNFSNDTHPEYERTNVNGTRYMLDHAKSLNIHRFIFASSVAACPFPEDGEALNEQTPPDADFDYAVTKKKGEDMCKDVSDSVPCSVVRFAAAFSDWCEYGPLYIFLETWFSKGWNSQILGGKGESAVPYIHVRCVAALLLRILRKSSSLPNYDVYIASPDGSTSHKELFNLSTRLFFGKELRSIKMPVFLAAPGVCLLYLFGKLIGKPPFERPWMMKYIDKKLTVDSSYTRKALDWEPTSRHLIERRLLYLIEHSKSYPVEWNRRNLLALERVKTERPNLQIAETMQRLHDSIINAIFADISHSDNKHKFPNYQQLTPDNLEWYLGIYYNLLMTSVRTGDRMSLVNYSRFLVDIRSREGFSKTEVCDALIVIRDQVILTLLSEPSLKKMDALIHDTIGLTIQLAIDEIEDCYERIEFKKGQEES